MGSTRGFADAVGTIEAFWLPYNAPIRHQMQRALRWFDAGNFQLEGSILFSFFDAGAAKEFGSAMALFFCERMPPDASLSEKQFAAKSLRTLEKMSLQIAIYKQKNALNTYKIAQMSNSFKWGLKDAGYEDAFIDRLTNWFVVKVQSRSSSV